MFFNFIQISMKNDTINWFFSAQDTDLLNKFLENLEFLCLKTQFLEIQKIHENQKPCSIKTKNADDK